MLIEQGLPGGAENEHMAPGGLQAEAGNHSEGAGLKSPSFKFIPQEAMS